MIDESRAWARTPPGSGNLCLHSSAQGYSAAFDVKGEVATTRVPTNHGLGIRAWGGAAKSRGIVGNLGHFSRSGAPGHPGYGTKRIPGQSLQRGSDQQNKGSRRLPEGRRRQADRCSILCPVEHSVDLCGRENKAAPLRLPQRRPCLSNDGEFRDVLHGNKTRNSLSSMDFSRACLRIRLLLILLGPNTGCFGFFALGLQIPRRQPTRHA